MVNINILNGGNITITTGTATTPTRIWWSNDESDFSDYPSNNGTFDSSCLTGGKSVYEAVKVNFGSDVTSIGSSAFYDCSDLTSVTIPVSVTSIGNAAFGCCTSLASVTIGNSVTSIGSSAFFCCSGLTSVTIPNSVTSIGVEAFYDCAGLTSVMIPDSVTSIGTDAFASCSELTSVTIVANSGNAENVKQMLISAGVDENITWNMPS